MIYLDSAATTLQKPPSVALASARAINTLSSPGRGGHRAAMMAAQTAYACREEAATLFHVPNPEQVVFTFNATHALNIAIKSLVSPGSRVVVSGYEHNAVTRPLHSIPAVELHVAKAPLFEPDAMEEAFYKEIAKGADVVICNHVSNAFGTILPIEAIGALCYRRGIPFIVDASQSAGILPIDFSNLGAAFVAMPGHKGLYGPQGTGLLLCGSMTAKPLMEGGTGSESMNQSMPLFLPDRLEAGTHNIAGIAGLLEGLRYLRRRGIDSVYSHEQNLIGILGEELKKLPGVEVFSSKSLEKQTGVLSFRIKGCDCEEMGERLGDAGFALRAGLHCAPLAHETAGTLDTGTIRASVSIFNTESEVLQLAAALEKLLK